MLFMQAKNKDRNFDTHIVSKLRSLFGGDEEDRTLDLTDANRTLSQLSYAPISHSGTNHCKKIL